MALDILKIGGMYLLYGLYALVSPPLPGDRRRALKWANRQRAKRGWEPISRLPRAQRYDPHACVFARAIDGHVDLSARFEGRASWVPRYVRAMVWTFDLGWRKSLVGDERASDLVVPTVNAADVMTDAEAEAVQREVRIDELTEQLGALEDSFAATARELRGRIRRLEQQREREQVDDATVET